MSKFEIFTRKDRVHGKKRKKCVIEAEDKKQAIDMYIRNHNNVWAFAQQIQ